MGKDFKGLAVSRRVFLGGAGASLVWQSIAVAAEDPEFLPQDGGWVVVFGGRTWAILPGMFDRGVRPTRVAFRKDGPLSVINLTGAVYPGTDLPAGFDATFYQREGVWFVRLGFVAFGQLVELPLRAWMAPRSDPDSVGYVGGIRQGKIDLGRGGLLSGLGDGTLTLWSDFTAHFAAHKRSFVSYRFRERKRQIGVTSNEMVFRLSVPEPGTSSPRITQFELSKATMLNGELPLGRVGASEVKASLFSPQVVIESFSDRQFRNANLTINAREGSLDLHGVAAGPNGSRIQLENVSLRVHGRAAPERLVLRGHVARRDGGRGFETKFFSAVLEGDESEVVEIVFDSGPLPSLSIKTKLVAAHVPIESDASADIAFAPATSCEILVSPRRQFPPAKERCGPCDAFIWIGDCDAGIQLPLEPARLRLRRSDDLLDLSFGFLHHALQCDSNGTRIRQRWAFVGGCKTLDRSSPRTIVHFPPQHVFEEAFLPPLPDQSPLSHSDGTDACGSNSSAPQRQPISSSDLARTRISGPTRLVFEEKCQLRPDTVESEAHALTVDYLTNWADMAMVVNKRALPRKATLKDQLENVGIDESTSRLDARVRVMAQALPPGDDETSIEAVYRLLFSPDSGARWKTSNRMCSHGRTPEVWQARLDNPDETAMRAIYARQMDVGFLAGRRSDSTTPEHVPEFAGSLSDDDRRQIVALTSFYGLAALRRIVVSKGGRTAGDDPAGMVFLPNQKYDYLDGKDYSRIGSVKDQDPDSQDQLSALPQEGVVFAKPFERFELTLSRSTNLDALWRGEPPAPLMLAKPEDPFFFPAFTIERYLHRIRDGRDAFVEVMYKGFLYPLGHRAAVLKVTRREFHPYKNADLTRPIAYLIQHLYIVCSRPLKTYRAFHQPFASRDFPPSTVELKTTKTPDIAVPETPEELRCRPAPTDKAAAPLRGVFWPRLLDPHAQPGETRPGREVMFEYAIDGGDQLARSPLLFVDNAAAHDPIAMARVTQYYNDCIGESGLLPGLGADTDPDAYLRVVDHGGAPRRYAAEQKDGECTFDTASWVLAARGLIRGMEGVGEIQDFHMDAFMEGRDQPPFYPIVKRAAINVQPINRLVGRNENTIAVEFNPRYVRAGFDPQRNPSEIYLNVLEPRIYLDASADGQSTGAVAKPNVQLAALSRKIGPVGGRLPNLVRTVPNCPQPSHNVESAQQDPGPRPVGVVEPVSSPITSALMGRFNPLEYFIGASHEARLLGIIPLKDILKAVLIDQAPKLVEKKRYLTKNIDDQIGALRAALTSAIDTIEDRVERALKTIRDNLHAIGGKDADPAALYPALWSALNSTLTTMREVRNTVDSGDDAATISAASALVAQVNRLLAELGALGRDPMPANVRDAIVKMKDHWQRIQAIGARKEIDNFVEGFADVAFHHVCQSAVESGVFESVFGPLNLESNPANPLPFPQPRPRNRATDEEMQQACERLLRDPTGTLPRLQEALFYEVLSEPLVAAIERFRAFKAAISANVAQQLQYSRRALADRIAVILRQRTESAELDALGEGAYVVAGEISRQLESLTESDLGPSVIEGVIEAKIAAVTATIGEQIQVIKQAADWEAARLKRDALDRLASAQEALRAGNPDLYYFLVSEQQKFESRGKALDLLSQRLRNLDTPRKIQDALGTDLRNAVSALLQPAIADAQAAFAENAAAAGAGLTRRLMQLADTLLTQAVSTASAVWISEAGRKVDSWCGDKGNTDKLVRVLRELVSNAIGPIGDSEKSLLDFGKRLRDELHAFETKLRELTFRVAGLSVPASAEPIRQQLSQLLSAIAANDQSLIAMIDEFERTRLLLRDPPLWSTICGVDAAASIETISHAIDMRRRIAEMLATAISNITDAVLSAARFPASARAFVGAQDLESDLAGLLAQLIDLARSITSISYLAAPITDVETAIEEFGLEVDVVKLAWKELKVTATTLKEKINEAKSNLNDTSKHVEERIEASLALRRDIAGFARQDRKFIASLVENCFAGTKLEIQLNNSVRAGLKRLVDLLLWVNGAVLEVAASIADDFTRKPGSSEQTAMLTLASIVPATTIKGLDLLVAALKADQGSLQEIKDELAIGDTIAKTLKLTRNLRERWRSDTPAVVATIEFVEQIVDAIASGNVQALIDVATLERDLRNAIAELIPAKVSLSYDLDAELPDFPPGDPIFAIDSNSILYDPTAGNDLVLSSLVELDFLTNERSVHARGTIRPFKVHLLGSGLDLVTIKFKGAEFSYHPQSGTHFTADIAGFTLGAALQFLSALSSLADGGDKSDDKNGFYHQYSVLPPEVEVGYRYNKPLLVLGSLTFQNIGFAISAHLPFDYRHAEFRASFATREKPFLVSQPTPIPLGGGGFVALRASARGVVAFEISLEFGAVCAIDIAPLRASGRVTVGMYLLSYQDGGRRFEGFMHAVGEGHIACFGLSFLIEVRTVQNGSSMEGSATYSFTFEVMRFEVSYSLTAHSKTRGGGEGATSAAVGLVGGTAEAPPAHSGRPVRCLVPPKMRDWKSYASHFQI